MSKFIENRIVVELLEYMVNKKYYLKNYSVCIEKNKYVAFATVTTKEGELHHLECVATEKDNIIKWSRKY